ncbi:glutamate-5-semialdehyde dehydrogenase [Cysteiniphilum sp. QT6929]|uniref:glutamate-5-semialdehyde dehydrogenase n=1 Tax=Cysteiniphilum sp. QT6929 TaxID=2975055 RepID=UPI0024B388C8|nr:glutamate-5-semialdehyde dehydrogenase [Cysteiniphilum sp. QT6929]WHN66011.1 glutamate-5-semialdehyde dehydrogenase [Cysteiniphilum sp. QT6929]
MINEYQAIETLCKQAKQATYHLASSTNDMRNQALSLIADEIVRNTDNILKGNAKDIENATAKGLSKAMLDRLLLTHERIVAMSDGLREIAKQPDPLHCVLSHVQRPTGLDIKAVSVPLGVIAVIYESRPNVTVDATGLCLKSGNAAILRGGSESFYSNQAIMRAIQMGLAKSEIASDAVQMLPTQERAAIEYLVAQDQYIDVVVPRGGRALIEYLTKHSKVPLFKHLDGICHTYVHHAVDLRKVLNVCVNAKMRRPSICGATETILLDRQLPIEDIDALLTALDKAGCALRLDQDLWQQFSQYEKAEESDWSTEYLDSIVSIKYVDDVAAAVVHINHYGSHHTDAILTEDQTAAQFFMQNVDSAVVMHNTSTQFSDGGEFGMGAEIGISTGKLHARGPVGIKQLTTFKYQVVSNGSVRA